MADFLETYQGLEVYEDKYDGVHVYTHNDCSRECAESLVSLIRKYKSLTFFSEVSGEWLNNYIQETIRTHVEDILGNEVLIVADGCERYPHYTYHLQYPTTNNNNKNNTTMKTLDINKASVINYVLNHNATLRYLDETLIEDDGHFTQVIIDEVLDGDPYQISGETVLGVVARAMNIPMQDREHFALLEVGSSTLAIDTRKYEHLDEALLPSPDDIYIFHAGAEDGVRTLELEGRMEDSGCPSTLDPDAPMPHLTPEDDEIGYDIVYARRVRDITLGELEAVKTDKYLFTSLFLNGILHYDI